MLFIKRSHFPSTQLKVKKSNSVHDRSLFCSRNLRNDSWPISIQTRSSGTNESCEYSRVTFSSYFLAQVHLAFPPRTRKHGIDSLYRTKVNGSYIPVRAMFLFAAKSTRHSEMFNRRRRGDYVRAGFFCSAKMFVKKG